MKDATATTPTPASDAKPAEGDKMETDKAADKPADGAATPNDAKDTKMETDEPKSKSGMRSCVGLGFMVVVDMDGCMNPS